jgi:DNA-binding GntR family transcriptional regulator
MATLQKISKLQYGKQTYEQLKYLIISGQIKAGEIINEQKYSEALGISRTPLRDALVLLENEGWLERSGKFRIVSPLRWKDILSLIEIREPMDKLSFELAIRKINNADVNALKDIISSMKRPLVKTDTYYYQIMRLDQDFHKYIAGISQNSFLIKFYQQMDEKFVRASVLSVRISGISNVECANDHNDIIQALENKDLDSGMKALHKHHSVWKDRLNLLPDAYHFARDDESAIINESFMRAE